MSSYSKGLNIQRSKFHPCGKQIPKRGQASSTLCCDNRCFGPKRIFSPSHKINNDYMGGPPWMAFISLSFTKFMDLVTT